MRGHFLTLSLAALLAVMPATADRVRALRWEDFPSATQKRLAAAGIVESSLQSFQEKRAIRTAERVRESDLDAMIYYALQSTLFTKEPPIEPAVSAKTFVDSLDEATRERFLQGLASPVEAVPAPARRRLNAMADVRDAPSGSRLAYFGDLLQRESKASPDRDLFLRRQYVRAARFLYEKEFVAQKRADRGEAVAALYHERGLSTDTAVEAGYLVYMGLGTMKALEPDRRIRRVLIVGPGLDLAPRTGLLEVGPPASYQPYAVVDALVSLGLSKLDDLVVLGADVNPRVVDHLHAAKDRDIVLTLVSGIGGGPSITLQPDYRSYFDALGMSIAEPMRPPVLPSAYDGHLRKALKVRRDAGGVVDGVSLDIAADRLLDNPVDLVIATNIFPYLDDVALTMALANISAMLAPGGVLLHNEPRPIVGEITAETDLPFDRARTGAIATVRGAAAPLADSVFMHVKRGKP